MNDRLRDMAFADAEVVHTASENVPALERSEAFLRCLTQSGILSLIVRCRAGTLFSIFSMQRWGPFAQMAR